jgi:secreted PhoX family phosphatase
MAATGVAKARYFAGTSGPGRASPKLFFLAPAGARGRGPALTPDVSALFLAIQRPGEDRGSTFENPSTRWPDFQNRAPPCSAVIAITKRLGGAVES